MTSKSSSPRPNIKKGRRERKERKCTICSQVFFKTEHLSRHIRSHTKEKPFECSVCHKIYARHDTLLRHLRSHNSSQQSSTSSPPKGTPRIALKESSMSNGTGFQSGASNHTDQASFTTFQPFSPQSISQGSTNPAYSSQFDPNVVGADAILQASALSAQQDAMSPNSASQQYLPPRSSSGTIPDQTSTQEQIDMGNSPSIDLWEFDFNSQWPSWLAGDDFDLKAVNSSIAATMNQYIPASFPQSGIELYAQELTHRTVETIEPGTLHAMKRRWFTYMDEDKSGPTPSGAATPRASHGPHGVDQTDMDENYRNSLSKRLRQRPYDDSLPSTEFLNLCIRMYFARFNPIFPIIHGPSFRPSTENALLLLSICSVGSLFIGSASATAHGTKIFETLNKSILASWENVIARSAAETLSMVQAAVIGQTFGMLSGSPRHLVLCESFHGTVIAWARQSKIFAERHGVYHVEAMMGNSEKIEKAWKSWVQSEHMIRITLGLHIHDAELAGIFHHEPFLRHAATRLPVAASSKKFQAISANHWAAVMLEEGQMDSMTPKSPLFGLGQPEPIPNRFYAYTILEGIGASISEYRESSKLDVETTNKFRDDLISWYDKFQRTHAPHDDDPLCLMILWHSNFLSLFADFDVLEQAIGREGSEKVTENIAAVVTWASSNSAKRCIIHASLMQKQLETIRIGTEPAIHVPLALFHAGLAWYCYTSFASEESQSSSRESLDFSEVKHVGANPSQLLFEAHGFKFGRPSAHESSTLCLLVDLLQRIGHWEIARKYGSILGSLLSNTSMDVS